MQPEIRDQIITALEAAMRKAGAENLEAGFAMVSRVFAFLLKTLEEIQDREKLSRVLDQMELSEADTAILLGAMENLPAIIRKLIEMFAKRAAEVLPAPPGGRAPALAPQQRQDACGYVGRLYAQGIALKVAKQRAAQRFSVSRRTIERAWAGRTQNGTMRFNMDDFLQELFRDELPMPAPDARTESSE